MTVTRLSWSDALAAVKVTRPCAAPNVGFQHQLQEFERTQADQVWGRADTSSITRAVLPVVTLCVCAVQRVATGGVQGQPLQRRGSYTQPTCQGVESHW